MRWLYKILPLDIVRKLLHSQAKSEVFKAYLSRPLPSPSAKLIDLEFIVLDLETTGLNPAEDNILSIGYTIIRNNHIILKEDVYQVIRQNQFMQSDNVAIHNITDTEAGGGDELKPAMADLIKAMSGRVMVAHHAAIETGFLNAASEEIFSCPLIVRVVDTMKLEMKKQQQRGVVIKSNDLRLFNIRKAYGLPRYKAHNALEDAVSTAELFIAMIAKYSDNKNSRLKEFL